MKRCKNKYIKFKICMVCVVSFYACSSNVEEDTQTAHIGYDNKISKPKITVYQEKHMVISALADSLFKNDGDDAILIGNVISDFFDEDGKLISTLYSDKARVEKISNNLTAFGSEGNDVRVESDSGKIYSQRIKWDNQYKLISSKDPTVFITSSGDVNNCLEFETDTEFKKWSCIGPRGKMKERKKD